MIITVGGIKGGSGKTMRRHQPHDLVGHGGRQGYYWSMRTINKRLPTSRRLRKEDHPTVPRYTCARLANKSVRTEVLEMASNYDHIIIDTGGRDSKSQRAALAIADLLLVPLRATQLRHLDAEKGRRLGFDEMREDHPRLAAFVFLNRSDPEGQGTENADAVAMLQEMPTLRYLDTPLRSRKAFAHAASQGLAVTELAGTQANPKAASEITALFQRCFGMNSTSDTEGVVHVAS